MYCKIYPDVWFGALRVTAQRAGGCLRERLSMPGSPVCKIKKGGSDLRKKSAGFICMLLLAICCLLPAGEAQAATAKKLFSLVINDGFVSQTVPVYQFTSGSSTYVAAKKNLRTLQVYAGAKNVKVSIKGKTSLYKSTFKSITYKKKAALSKNTTLKYTLKTRKGGKKTFEVKLTRPAMPKISSLTVPSSFTPGGSNRLTVKLKTSAGVAVKATYKIKNSKGKVVYNKTLGTRKSCIYTAFWTGKPSAKNAAGLPTSEYVPAGTYKLTAYLKYTVGGKSKNISKTVSFKVKEGKDQETENPADTTVDSSFAAKSWSWKVGLTGDDTLDYLAEVVCQQVLSNGMSEAARAKALYTWCGKNLIHQSGAPKLTGSGKNYMDITSTQAKAAIEAYGKQADSLISTGKAAVNVKDNYFGSSGMQKTKINWGKAAFVKRYGDCLIMSLTYETLCRHAGLTVDIVENDGSAGHHFWNVVRIGNAYYYADVNQFTESWKSGNTNYGFFLKGTNYCYQYGLYSTVKQNNKYKIAKSVSKTDCPGI